MEKITTYIAIKAINTIDLSRWVNDHIGMGFQPFGGMCCSALTVDENDKPTNTAVFCQAMVKYA